MELKPYQQQVVGDLKRYLEHLQTTKDIPLAFSDYWAAHPVTPLQPFPGTAVEPYKNNVPRVPHICLKVPTAGGKTFIACNAIKTIFDAFDLDKPKAVMWLVPSITILDQTLKNLRNPDHPYRRKLNSHFGSRVAVFDKAELLQGKGFNATSVQDQLTIMVFSFDSLRARKKEDRKVFQENGNLQSFEHLLGKNADITLGEVIKYLHPVAVVDESHNAETELSVKMLTDLNPSVILDLTATPRKNSNIISFVDALELKAENMVKIPVIVNNHSDKTGVISSAIQFQKKLERTAKVEEEQHGGKYIRPIVLFQAQPKSNKDNTTFEKLKAKLVELNIPEEQIKIKTANINEIKGLDLLSRDCPVRYIITINALKEGWDCPFAYILASLANKSSAVDVEQILGRVLRQPYVRQHKAALLNMSYVFTASNKFLDTLDNIVKGLNRAGFSEKDYRVANTATEENKATEQAEQLELLLGKPTKAAQTNEAEPEDITADIDEDRIKLLTETDAPTTDMDLVEKMAYEQHEATEQTLEARKTNQQQAIPSALEKDVKKYQIKAVFSEAAAQIKLPQFHHKVDVGEIFSTGEKDVLLEKNDLLKAFRLSKEDTNIKFDDVAAELYKVDLDEDKKDNTPSFMRLDNGVKEALFEYILDPARKEARAQNLTNRVSKTIGNMYPISDDDIKKYLNRIFADFTDEQVADFIDNELPYVNKIKKKIIELSENYAAKIFKKMLDTDAVFMGNSYQLAQTIVPGKTSKDIAKSLYEKEGSINSYEERVINEVANMQNILFWTRNPERTGFRINGFINHYPDFIIQSKKGKTIVLETKGDHLDAEQKITLGNLWASKAGNDYRYFMVYDKRDVDGAYKLDKFLELMKEI